MVTGITIKDVAELAGCSPTTVSRVINNSDHPVSEDTAKNVRDAVKKLEYSPNRIAQGLKSDKSNIIGVIVHDLCDPYYAKIVKGIGKSISSHEYILNIYNTNHDQETELQAVKALKSNRADALIFAGGAFIDSVYKNEMRNYIDYFKNQNTVLLGITPHPFDIFDIDLQNENNAELITNYIIEKGHSKIAYINGPQNLFTSILRQKGYKKALKNNDILLNKNLFYEGDFSFEGGRKAALEILDSSQEITAVVAANDATALGLIWELNHQGIRVPNDISVVGIDGLSEGRYSYPPLTTVSIPAYELGISVGRYILQQFQIDLDFKLKSFKRILTERDSVKDLNKIF